MEGSDILFGPLRDTAPPGAELITVTYPSGDKNGYNDLLPRVRAILPTDRPFYLLGWSFSGPMALMVAAERPANLRGVILAASFVRHPLPRWMRRIAQPWLFKLCPATYPVKALLNGADARGLRDLVARAIAQADSVALASRARAGMTVDATEHLKHCPVPVMYLRATEDRLIAARHAEEARRLLPGLRIVDMPGPHMALVTDPSRSWSALSSFMDECEFPSARMGIRN
jgi:pimeloyl-ACP methyl ester carboxylesterase